MSAANNSNESYCTFTLASDVTAGGLPSEEEIAKQLESNDPKRRGCGHREQFTTSIYFSLPGQIVTIT
eukprot:scaffold12137_cov136-Skeletonema_menzelii.AAC.5